MNPLELVYILIFNIYRILSSKSKTLETVWYRLAGTGFKPELIRIDKHSILNIVGITRIYNKTDNTTEYIFKYLEYKDILKKDKLFSFRSMLVYISKYGVITNPQWWDTRVPTKSTFKTLSRLCSINEKVYTISKNAEWVLLGGSIGVLKMDILYSINVNTNAISILGIPDDILLMLDKDNTLLNQGLNKYIRLYHDAIHKLLLY